MTDLTIERVATNAQRRAFRWLPFRLYRGDPHWVPPLHRDIKTLLAPGKHPFCASGEMEFFLARRGSRVVGRIAAIHNRDHQRHHADGAGFFGFFESEQDPEAAGALLNAVSEWVRPKGCNHLLGPTSPSLNYESGLFVHGDPGPPHIMMPHNPPYYAELLEQSRCIKAQDLLAYYLHKDLIDIERWGRMAERLRDRARVSVRTLDMTRFREEVRLIVDLFNDAWSANWGFVPMNEREIQHMATELRHLVRPELCAFVEREGEAVGFYLLLPNYNIILRTARGRVLPFTLPRLLRAKRNLRCGRVLLMGVRRAFQHLGIDAVLNGEIVRACLTHGIDETESGWLLESNAAMINTLERVGSRLYRTYRVYRREM